VICEILAGSARAGPLDLVVPAPPPPPRERQVYHVSLPIDLTVITVTGLGYMVPLRLERKLIDFRCPCDPNEVPKFERWAVGLDSYTAATLSDITVALSLGVPPVADFLALGMGRPLKQDLIVYTETITVSGALMNIFKYLLQRPVPLAYTPNKRVAQIPASYRSFYAGHVAYTVGALTTAAWTIRLRYGEQVWPWFVVAGAGASIVAELILSGSHFPSDNAVGALAGVAVGTLIPLLHARPLGKPGGFTLVPSGHGIAITGSF
jgi:hypothetical protein